MTTLNFANQALGKLRGIKLPSINRGRITKFFYEAFLDLREDEMPENQKLKTKRE